MRSIRTGLLALSLLVSTGARDLPVPAGKGWQHARTGLILPAQLDGLPRFQLSDKTLGEWDVVAEFIKQDDPTIATIHVYHPAIDDVTLWFDRSRKQLEDRRVFGKVEPTTPEPVAFVPPGASRPAGALRQTFKVENTFKSVSLAVIPLGDWLVAVRLSSFKATADELDERMSRTVAAIRWPTVLPPAPPLRAIGACPAPLAFEKARVVKGGGADLLLTLLGASMANDPKVIKTDSKPVAWCIDPATTQGVGVYRPLGDGKGYLLALQDAGRTMGVWPSLGGQLGTKDAGAYAVTLGDVDGRTIAYPSFDKLPAPAQVVALLKGGSLGSTGGTGADGKRTINLNANAL